MIGQAPLLAGLDLIGCVGLTGQPRNCELSEVSELVESRTLIKEVISDKDLEVVNMEAEEQKDVEREVECSIRPTVNPGTFSIESILKSGGFRCGPPQPEFPPLSGGFRHGLGENPVKREQDDGRDDLPGGSMAGDMAPCQDDSGKGACKYYISWFCQILDPPYISKIILALQPPIPLE